MFKNIWVMDIGNSTIALARKRGTSVTGSVFYDHSSIPKIVSKIDKSGSNERKIVFICSVVPKITAKIVKSLKRIKSLETIQIGRNYRVPIRTGYSHHAQLGLDRQVNAYAALKLYKPPLLIFDFGSATVVNYISAKGVFEGGLICAGIRTSLEALSDKTALLPRVTIKPIRNVVGRDTRGAMLAGAIFGQAAMVGGLVQHFKKQAGKGLKTIGTGGMVDIIAKSYHKFDLVDRLLTLKGLSWLADEWLTQR